MTPSRKQAPTIYEHELSGAFGTRRVALQIGAVVTIGITVWIWVVILGGPKLEATVYALDVGQGDSQLVVLPSPDRRSSVKILIDAGKNRQVVDALDRALGARGGKYIDILLMTHPDLDHFGGFVEVLKRYEVGIFISNGLTADSKAFASLQAILKEKNVRTLALSEGDAIRYANDVLDILSPDDVLRAHKERNEASVVAKLTTGAEHGGATALFTADIGAETERLLIRKGYDLSADILKVGHHGSKYSSSENFLAVVSPLIATIGVGQNRYGHPTARVLEALSLSGADMYRTDENGTVAIYLERASVPKKETGGFLAAAASVLTGSYKTDDMTAVALAEVRAGSKKESSLVSFDECSYKTSSSPAHSPLIVNEIAWMGAPSGATHEWIELRNTSGKAVNLTGWQIVNENERVHFTFPQQAVMSGEYVLVARSAAGVATDYNFTGAIRNSKEGLRLFDNHCRLIDEIPVANSWPAGNSKTKQTMERQSDLSWVSSRDAGGTPGAANSKGIQTPPVETPAVAPAVRKGCLPNQININTASKTELMNTRHIGEARADDIIENRPFASLAGLRGAVSGIGEARLADILAEGLACVQ